MMVEPAVLVVLLLGSLLGGFAGAALVWCVYDILAREKAAGIIK